MHGEGLDVLFTQLHSSHKDVRVAVLNALATVDSGDPLTAIANSSPDDWFYSRAVQTEDDASLLQVGKLAFSSLSKALYDSSSEIRAEAATAFIVLFNKLNYHYDKNEIITLYVVC